MKTLSELDWNFDNVPDDELMACCYWEYARESAFIRDTLREYRDWFLAGGKWDENSGKLGARLEKIQCSSEQAGVFVRGCALGNQFTVLVPAYTMVNLLIPPAPTNTPVPPVPTNTPKPKKPTATPVPTATTAPTSPPPPVVIAPAPVPPATLPVTGFGGGSVAHNVAIGHVFRAAHGNVALGSTTLPQTGGGAGSMTPILPVILGAIVLALGALTRRFAFAKR